MSTIVAAGPSQTEQSLPKAAVWWCLKTLAISLVLIEVPALVKGLSSEDGRAHER